MRARRARSAALVAALAVTCTAALTATGPASAHTPSAADAAQLAAAAQRAHNEQVWAAQTARLEGQAAAYAAAKQRDALVAAQASIQRAEQVVATSAPVVSPEDISPLAQAKDQLDVLVTVSERSLEVAAPAPDKIEDVAQQDAPSGAQSLLVPVPAASPTPAPTTTAHADDAALGKVAPSALVAAIAPAIKEAAAPGADTAAPAPSVPVVDTALTQDLTAVAAAVEQLSTQVEQTAAANIEAARIEAERAAAQAAAEAAAADRANRSAQAASYPNGTIPGELLCELSFAPGQYLRCDAAWSAEQMSASFAQTFGYPIGVRDSYRSYREQIEVKAERGAYAARPGTSNHGFGLAVDWNSGVEMFGTPQHQWMKAHAGEFGWTHPDWAEPGHATPEPWHWEFKG